MSKGKLIAIEGLDGSGKATQAKLLAGYLAAQGLAVREVSFPDYGSDSSALVKMYLAGQFGQHPDDVNAYAASSFYAVDRYASYKKTGAAFTRTAASSLQTGTPPPMRCTSAPSCRQSSGKAFSAGCLTTNSICWACLRRMR